MRLSVLMLLMVLFTGTSFSQNRTAKKKTSPYPESFTISKLEYDGFFKLETNTAVNAPANKYIHKAVLELNTLNGDMRLLRLRLGYFPKGILLVQVNGTYSTQVFITTNDKKLSYKGKISPDGVTFTKCNRDDIYTE